MAAYPRSFQVFTQRANAVPPPPCTSTIAGTFRCAEAPFGRPHHANTRVGRPRQGSPAIQIGSTPATRPYSFEHGTSTGNVRGGCARAATSQNVREPWSGAPAGTVSAAPAPPAHSHAARTSRVVTASDLPNHLGRAVKNGLPRRPEIRFANV